MDKPKIQKTDIMGTLVCLFVAIFGTWMFWSADYPSPWAAIWFKGFATLSCWGLAAGFAWVTVDPIIRARTTH